MNLINMLIGRQVQAGAAVLSTSSQQAVAMRFRHSWLDKKRGFIVDVPTFLAVAEKFLQLDKEQTFEFDVPHATKELTKEFPEYQQYQIPAWAFKDAQLAIALTGASLAEAMMGMQKKIYSTMDMMKQQGIDEDKAEGLLRESTKRLIGDDNLFYYVKPTLQ